MEYKSTLKKLYEAENMEYKEAAELDDGPIFNDDVIEEPEVSEDVDEITVASKVRVIDGAAYEEDDIKIVNGEFDTFISKVDDGEIAIVFDEDEDTNFVDIVFEDGLEAFAINKDNLELAEEDVVPEDEEDFEGELKDDE